MVSAVPSHDALTTLVADLRAAPTFEKVADVALAPMLEAATRAIDDSPYAGSATIARGVVYLRPGNSYRSVAVREARAKSSTATSPPVDVQLPSATAWQWVVEHEQPIAIDVLLGQVRFGIGEQETLSDRRFGQKTFATGESRSRLLHREVTHLFVVPLRGADDRVCGMVALEARCQQAVGRPFIWAACSRRLQLIADLAAPYLASRPLGLVKAPEVDPHLPVIGASMASTIALLRVFAQQQDPILITGPTGVGKSRLARWCHEQSEVGAQPFEVLDLSSIPEELQLAELFGWRKGAFTGAVRDNPGVVTRAKGGTLFIDEIDNLSARAQAGLLHVLEERTFRVLGDEGGERAADVRFIIGTNARLEEAVREHRFREDLYYRINVLPVRLPALRERPDEIGPWASYFARRHHTKRTPEGTVTITAAAERLLREHPWPGNLRQLDNIVRRAYAMAVVGHGAMPARDVILEEEHLRSALAYDEAPREPVLLDVLTAAATAFADEAIRRASKGGLDLDLADAFRGLVLGATARRLAGDRDEALRVLGREKFVTGRNRHKVLRREMDRVELLCGALGIKAPVPFGDLMGDDAKDGSDPHDGSS